MQQRQEVLQVLFDKLDNETDIGKMVFDMNAIFMTKTSKQKTSSEVSYIGINEELVDQSLNVYDEVLELIDAIKDNDTKEIKDALADILTFGYGAMYILNVTDFDNLINNYVIKLDNSAFSSMEDFKLQSQALATMFTTCENTIGNIVEAVHFANEWSRKLKLDLLPLMRAVTKSNYTKLLLTMEEAVKTDSYYEKMGVLQRYTKFATIVVDGKEIHYGVLFSGADQTDYNNKAYRRNKFIKCVEFRDPIHFMD